MNDDILALKHELSDLRREVEDMRILLLGLIAGEVEVRSTVQYVPDGTLDRVN